MDNQNAENNEVKERRHIVKPLSTELITEVSTMSTFS